MFVTKCDICKKEIKGNVVVAGADGMLSRQTFCQKCGKPVLSFLNKIKKSKVNKKKHMNN
ncbi:MAG: hypothetical protein A3J47_02725 [Candidatus Yanofskybacteria bacterium RIFCSPHIGHO2_02_FULL_43_22]|uniref:Uncharacterized protein n=1 Tax=Candidatus Yanofskybacteria bacterium RIFCSPHIGHO2_02_FULL_43_22 TaxID=1802681 RepID=A0A1F8FRC4_9BACT|nr:MAG: hypothetical protein A3J47_02725 [Candidatus Yanofskybacteria bacterium RIFCSPHIGHO2_02_FULL_43_22]